MKEAEVRKYILESLKSKYINDEEKEWIDVRINGRNYIDIIIVSNSIININEFYNEIEMYISNSGKEYKKGLIRRYTVDEADEYAINKPKMNARPNTLEDAVNYIVNPYEIIEDRNLNSQVISFYSYKGGVGRTLSMIHTAYILAQQGKNVLMIDLDIEAPSLHNIFKKEADELEYGLIDYLYSKINDKPNSGTISINDIHTKIGSGDTETLDGSMYLIPAGKLTREYIYKLSKIQPKLVSKRDYLRELIKDIESKQNLNLDMVLIDTRTGLNDWGAMSLLGISDKVVFFTYPNSENIEGTKVIIDFIRELKDDNLSIVFSRGDKGADKTAKKLFESLNINQEYLEILYDPNIAIAEKFPIKGMINNCQPIAELLLEQEQIDINKKFLSLNKDKIKTNIEELKKVFISHNFNSKVFQMDQIEKENIYLVVNKHNYINEYYINNVMKKRGKVYSDNGVPRIDIATYISDKNNIITENIFNYKNNFKLFWHSYILNMLESYHDLNTNIRANIEFIEKNIDNNYDEIIKEYKKYTQKEDNDKIYNILKQDKIAIEENSIVILANLCLNENNIELYELIDDLKEVEIELNKHNIKISIKIFIEDNKYNQNRDFYDTIKSNVFYLEWKKNDIEQSILNNLIYNKNIFMSYAYYFTDSISVYDKIEFGDLQNNKEEFIFDDIFRKEQFKKSLIDLVLGKRIKVGTYSKKVSDWFYKKLIDIDGVDPITSDNMLAEALGYELEDTIFDDRIISFQSLEKAFIDKQI